MSGSKGSSFWWVVFAVIILGGAIGGIQNLGHHGAASSTDSSTTDSSTSTGDAAAGFSKDVSRSMFGSAWPLTVDAGVLGCYPDQGGSPGTVITITVPDQGTYALNGTARELETEYGYLEVDPIWADDPGTSGLKKDISVLTDLCSQ